MSSEATSVMFEQYAQDPLANFDEDYPVLARLQREPKKKKVAKRNVRENGTQNKTNRKEVSSFVINKQPIRGSRLIRIQVLDLETRPQEEDSGDTDEEKILLSAQYVVRNDVYDDVMDDTEDLINKISKKICVNN